MKKKLTLAIAAYVLLVAGILTYIYCPRTVIKNTAMWYEKDFTIPIFCKTVEFKQLYDLGLYNGKFEVSKDQAEKIVKQLDDALERFENSMKQSEEGLSYKELEIKKNTTNVSKYVYSDETKSITTSAAYTKIIFVICIFIDNHITSWCLTLNSISILKHRTCWSFFIFIATICIPTLWLSIIVS